MEALIVTGGECPSPSALEVLARAADLVVAADSGLDALAPTSILPDYIVGDFDSLTDRSLLKRYENSHIIKYPSDKDATDTEIALDLCLAKGADRISVAGGGGGRLDHLLGILYLFKRPGRPWAWHGSRESAYLVPPGSLGTFKVELGATVSVFPLMEGSAGMESAGLKWPLEGLAWDPGRYGISNEATDGRPRIRAGGSALLVVLPAGSECLLEDAQGSPGILH